MIVGIGHTTRSSRKVESIILCYVYINKDACDFWCFSYRLVNVLGSDKQCTDVSELLISDILVSDLTICKCFSFTFSNFFMFFSFSNLFMFLVSDYPTETECTWSEWSSCSASCGVGIQRRQLTLLDSSRTLDPSRTFLVSECDDQQPEQIRTCHFTACGSKLHLS